MTDSSLYIGLISGTSMDGVDCTLVDFSEGCRVLDAFSDPYPPALRDRLIALLKNPACCNLDELGALDRELADRFAGAVRTLLERNRLPPDRIAAVGSHGQTIRHRPPDGASTHTPYTLQAGDPNRIAELTGITTVADFRRRDMAAGGQGAPLVPAFHAAVLADGAVRRAVVNIGGIANVTVLEHGDVRGFDTGPGNCLLDAWMREHFGRHYDDKGETAAGGAAVPALLARLLDDPYFRQAPPKTTGPEYFNLDWLSPHLAGQHAGPADVLHTLNLLTATTIARAVNEQAPSAEQVLLCGGGVHNRLLVKQLGELMPGRLVDTTAAAGLNPDFVEAAAFAWLARRTLSGQPGTAPSVTGASHATVLGGIYRG